MEDYSKRDQKKYREYVEKNYKSLMHYDAKYREFIDEYFPDYDYAKVNRLLQMRSDIFSILSKNVIDNDLNKTFSDRLEDILKRSYASNANVFAQIVNPDVLLSLPQKEIESYLNYPWSGKTFSSRLWGNIAKLEERLSKAIADSVASGQGVVDALNTMRLDTDICDMFKQEEEKFDNAIENLVRTEYAKFAQDGIERSYTETGVEEYDVLTAKDEKVCRICGGKASGNPYKLKDAIIGFNRGPFHGRCRCTDVPHMPELDARIDEEYERLFGDMLDEFANDGFGVKLKRPKRRESGALDDRNPKEFKQLTKFALQYYDEFRKRNRKTEISTVAKNAGISYDIAKQIFDHVFINEYDLEGGKQTFFPDYDMAHSWQRLREGKNIQYHDRIMLEHELFESILMSEGMSYMEAHLRTNELYNYQKLLDEFKYGEE